MYTMEHERLTSGLTYVLCRSSSVSYSPTILAKAPLWLIKEHPIYLLGTVHLGPPGGFRFPRFAEAFIECHDVAYFELDPFAKPDTSLMLRSPTCATTLAEEIGDVLYGHLQAQGYQWANPLDAHVAGALGILIQEDQNVKKSLKGSAKYFKEWGVDRAVCGRYESQKKEVQFLETDATQVQALVTGPIEEIRAELEYWRTHGHFLRAEGDEEFLTLFQKGDFDALGRLRAQIDPLRPTKRRAMLREREAPWVQKIKQIALTRRPTLIAVGVLHLPGEDGLLAQLRHAGYTPGFIGDH